MAATYTLDSAEETHREFPATFEIPALADRESLRPGDFAKLMFRITADGGVLVERMWVRVQESNPDFYIGVLDNHPSCTEQIAIGTTVDFEPAHVIQIKRNSV